MTQQIHLEDQTGAAESFQTSLKGVTLADIIKLAENLAPIGAPIGNGRMAINLYRSWIAANQGTTAPLFAAWFNIGVEFAKLKQMDQAVSAYRCCLTLKPDFHQAAINLGLSLEALGHPAQALAVWNDTLQADEARIGLLNHKARLSEQLGDLRLAEATLRASLLIEPAQPDAIQHWVHIRQKLCRWPVLTDIIPGLSEDDLLMTSGPLGALALTDSVALQREIAANWIERKIPTPRTRLAPAPNYNHAKIRVGYLSSDFCRHAMCYLIAQLFERHDRTRFEIYGYCASPDDHSEIRTRVINSFDHFRIIRALSDAAAAELIQGDEIDILIDLNGLTAGTRIAVLRHRPAPVQATYLGFIGPVPLPELDYIFADDFVIPPALGDQYSPKPLSIAHNYQANDQVREIGPGISRTAAGLPEDRFVFCCFSNHYKITEDMFTAWMKILRNVGHAVLWLVDDNPVAKQNMCNRARALGVDPERLIFAPRADPAAYMSRMALADLFLDTFPYNAGTIASDAIRMNVPIVTLMGESFASRMAGRFLTDLGAVEGITASLEEYIATACTMALNDRQRCLYRAKFGAVNWRRSIGDVERFTREFEDTLAKIALR